MASTTLTIRMESTLKTQVESVAESLGLSAAAAFNVFARQFVAHRGFPFRVVTPSMTEEEFAVEMDRRFEDVLAGHGIEHEIVEEK